MGDENHVEKNAHFAGIIANTIVDYSIFASKCRALKYYPTRPFSTLDLWLTD